MNLELQGIAKRGYGGAVVANDLPELEFIGKTASHPEEKAAIAQRAAEFAPEGSIVFLDAGSIVLEVARQLVLKKDMTIFTNSLPTAHFLAGAQARVYILGGEIDCRDKVVCGEWAARQLAEVRAGVAYLDTDGFFGCPGPCVGNLRKCWTKRAMVEHADKVVVVAESGKALATEFFEYARWEEVHALVIDAGAPAGVLEALREKTRVVTA